MSAQALPLPVVAGYVEAASEARILGWAWAPRDPSLRVAIELRDGDAVVAQVIADRPREDLAKNGIGDGAHAFALEVPEGARARAASLGVFAVGADGVGVSIGALPARQGLEDRLDQIQRNTEMLVGSHRLLHRNLQALMTRETAQPADSEALSRIETMVQGLTTRIQGIEIALLRLDEQRSTGSDHAPGEGRRGAGGLLVAMTLAGALLAGSLVGLRSALRF